MAGLSLHSQMLAIELLILAGYGAFRWAVGPLALVGVGRAWLGRLIAVARVCAPVGVLGLGLAAVQLVPLIELAGFSRRGSGIPYSESAAYSLTPYGLVQAIFPYVFRGPGNQQWGLWTHWESYLYIGLVPLVLATVALVCVRRREVLAWGVMGGLGLILALGQYSPINLHYLLWLLPGLSGLRAPGRFTRGGRPGGWHARRLRAGLVADSQRVWPQPVRQPQTPPPARGVLGRAGLPRGRRHRAARSPADLAVQRAGRDSGRVPVAAPR